MDALISTVAGIEDFLWSYLGFPVLLFLGIYFSIKSRLVQIRKLPLVFKIFISFFKVREQKEGAVHPLKAFFAAVGGCVGIGNIVGICTAVQLGGPGALFWIWIAALAGMIVKYSEVYLGMRYRVSNGEGGYNGGPMYFLQRVFQTKWVPYIVCLLLCVYGVEVYQFTVVTNSITMNLHFNRYIVIFSLLFLVLFAGSGGVRRVGNIASMVIPLFVVIYVGMGGWVLIQNITYLPSVIANVFAHAFTSHAAIGGFIGAGILHTISHGIRRGCYTGDIGIGYASVIHSESSAQIPEKQAALGILDIFLDTYIICTTSVLLILATDVWHQPIDSSLVVQVALGNYFPYMQFFMPFFLFLLGYSTINAYFCVGVKCAEFLAPKMGKKVFYVYATSALILFSFVDSALAQSFMMIAAALLLLINCYGFFRLRHEISFDFSRLEETSVRGQEVELRVNQNS